jgi:hypothetical protein
MNPAPLSVRELAPRVVAGWNRFFHDSRHDVRTFAIIRIGYAVCLLINLAVWFPYLDVWFTDAGVLPLAAAKQFRHHNAWSLLDFAPTTSKSVGFCAFIFAAHSLFLALGCFTKINAIASFVWLVSFQNRNIMILDGEDVVLRMIGFCLIFMPGGACWSIDSWRRRGGDGFAESHRSGFGLRLLQLQMCVIFFSAALCKLQGELWWNGTAMYYITRLEMFMPKFPVPSVLGDTPMMIKLMTWGSMAVEFFIPLLLWFRETRRFALVTAIAFDLACEYSMNLFLFHWIMILGWSSFASTDDYRLIDRFLGRSIEIIRMLVFPAVSTRRLEGAGD